MSFENRIHSIALVDVDQTLVDNHTSEYNVNLINFLHSRRFDAVYLVTGRNLNDFWQHVLNQGNPDRDWPNQLLYRVKEKLEASDIKVLGVSTPYDHYLHFHNTTISESMRVTKPGDAFNKFYFQFEQAMANKCNVPNQRELRDKFTAMTKGKSYPDGINGNTELADALPTYLAINNDTEKKGQVEFLLDSIPQCNEVYFFDDKRENLNALKEVVEKRNLKYIPILVESVRNFNPPYRTNDHLVNNFLENINLLGLKNSHYNELLDFQDFIDNLSTKYFRDNDFNSFVYHCKEKIDTTTEAVNKHNHIFGKHIGKILAIINHFFQACYLHLKKGEFPPHRYKLFNSSTKTAKELQDSKYFLESSIARLQS